MIYTLSYYFVWRWGKGRNIFVFYCLGGRKKVKVVAVCYCYSCICHWFQITIFIVYPIVINFKDYRGCSYVGVQLWVRFSVRGIDNIRIIFIFPVWCRKNWAESGQWRALTQSSLYLSLEAEKTWNLVLKSLLWEGKLLSYVTRRYVEMEIYI